MQQWEAEVEGETLRGHIYYPPKKPIGGVLWVHGFGSNSLEFGPAPKHMADAGFTVVTFDGRGFGQSDGDEGFLTHHRVQADIRAALTMLESACKGPIGIVGHSLGAYHSLQPLQEAVRVGALVQPVHDLMELIPGRVVWKSLAKLGQKRLHSGKGPKLIKAPSFSSHLFVDKECAKWSDMDAWHATHVDIRCGDFALQMDGLEQAKRIQKSVLVIGSKKDKRVPWKHSEAYLAALAGPTEVFMHNGGHSCFRDVDGPEVVARLNDFFLQQWSKA